MRVQSPDFARCCWLSACLPASAAGPNGAQETRRGGISGRGGRRQRHGGRPGAASRRGGKAAHAPAHAAARRSLALRQHLSLAVVWTRPVARRAREHDRRCASTPRCPIGVRFRAREYEKVRLARRRCPTARWCTSIGKGDPAQGARRGKGRWSRSRSPSTARSGAPSSRAKSKRSSTTSSKAASPPRRRPRAALRAGRWSRNDRRRCRPGISELLARAEASLADGHCEEYYSQFMSPNFNRATSRSPRARRWSPPAPTARARARP